MAKKTKKVKKKLVKYIAMKKKKNIKNKSVKIKYTKQVKKKRKRKKKVTIEDLYKIINKVQSKRKSIVFVTELIDASTMENIIKDTINKYDKTIMVTQVVFTLYPNPEDNYDEMLQLEYMDDEIIEDGQIFP